MRRLLALVAVAAGVASCYPELPDERFIDNLRVLAIQQEPATWSMHTGAAPPLWLRALTVDPEDVDGAGVTHLWELALDDDFEGVEQLRALLPDPPHGPDIELDLAALAGRDEVVSSTVLPFRYLADDGELTREALRLVYLDLPEGPPGDDDDSADEPAAAAAVNPRITELRLGDDRVFGADDLPPVGEPLFIGAVDPDAGIALEVDVEADPAAGHTQATLFWTAGCPGLPELFDLSTGSDSSCPTTVQDGMEEQADFYEAWYGFDSQDDAAERRRFAWFPLVDMGGRTPRLFLVLLDDRGGQSWLELRPS